MKHETVTQNFLSVLTTPIGELGIFADNKAIYCIEFIDKDNEQTSGALKDYQENSLTLKAKEQLEEYFLSRRQTFELPLAPRGTPFQNKAWQALLQIPFGETRYYGQQAELMQNQKAVRAVGAANGANPIAIVIPCHRVIGKNGALTGYAGGLEKKAWLLNFENAIQP